MKAKISEIFYSVQGEGIFAGTRQVFIRFFGCHIHCAWCDTPQSIGDDGSDRFMEYTLKEAAEEVSRLSEGCHSVSLTGGEPLLQSKFISGLLPEIKKLGLRSYLDTNGILFNALSDIIDDTDIIAMDIKMPTSTQCQPFWPEHKRFLKIASQKELFIKTVVSLQTSLEDIKKAVDIIACFDCNIAFVLQPNHLDVKDGVVQKCIEFQKTCLKRLNDVRIIPQMHKFMKVR